MFRVEWTSRVRQQIQSIWRNADGVDRAAMKGLLLEIESELRRRADEVGESREFNARIAFNLPLGFHDWVEDQPRTDGLRVATVARMWRVEPHNR